MQINEFLDYLRLKFKNSIIIIDFFQQKLLFPYLGLSPKSFEKLEGGILVNRIYKDLINLPHEILSDKGLIRFILNNIVYSLLLSSEKEALLDELKNSLACTCPLTLELEKKKSQSSDIDYYDSENETISIVKSKSLTQLIKTKQYSYSI